MTKWHVRGHWKGGENSCNRYFRETGAGKLSKVGFYGPKSHSSFYVHQNARILYIYNINNNRSVIECTNCLAVDDEVEWSPFSPGHITLGTEL